MEPILSMASKRESGIYYLPFYFNNIFTINSSITKRKV